MAKTKEFYLRSFTILTLLFLTFSCEKEDNVEPSNDTFRLEAYQYQVAQIHSAPNSFSGNSYIGNIGDQEIEFSVLNDSVLVFYVDDIEPGIYELQIPVGEGLSGEVTVLETQLNGEPSIVINTLINKLENIADELTIDNSNAQLLSAIAGIKEVYENATPDEQFQMAAYYHANKDIFEAMLNPDASSINGRVKTDIDAALSLGKYQFSVATMGAGVAVAILAPVTVPVVKAVGIGVAVAGVAMALENYKEFKAITLKIVENKINSIIEGRVNESTTFIVDQPYLISISSSKRNVDQADEDDPLFAKFFVANEKLADVIDKINSVIDFLNEELFFFNMDNIEGLPVLSGDAVKELPISETDYNNYDFNISYTGINVTTILDSEGKVKVTLSADENVDFSTPVETNLIIGYKDDFNDFIKSYDIQVIERIIPHLTLVTEVPESEYISSTIDPVTVSVVDQYNNPIEGVLISWEITEGEGQLTSEDIATNTEGLASASWKIGSAPGNNQLVVRGFDNGEEIEGSSIVIDILGEFDLKHYLVSNSPWEWNNYNEHAFYKFTEGGSLTILWEVQEDGEFTGEYKSFSNTFDIIDDDTFRAHQDDEIMEYTLVQIEEGSFTAKVCVGPGFNDCDTEAFVSTK